MAATSLFPSFKRNSHSDLCVINVNASTVIQTINRHRTNVFCGIFSLLALPFGGYKATVMLLALGSLVLINFSTGLFPICFMTTTVFIKALTALIQTMPKADSFKHPPQSLYNNLFDSQLMQFRNIYLFSISYFYLSSLHSNKTYLPVWQQLTHFPCASN